ncbi:capsid protein [Nudaurelia capensis beta virus]|uniref:Capsid protein n=1 Tax=Nudaurelia capensis beta virus (isolate Pine emperor moth/South Africa) TaxID=652108 RepID=CAPSD_NCBVS|nr:capsid protein [Nudaurelia capensis beta virus]Q9YRB2.1 RecName: Full=Capsid protein; Short=CP; AltName: Full=Coat protein; Contains: RecName: Full=Large capsid protein; Contains: RecName: Full=Small capsid protein [Nudaurelia capensis beta virus isolate South Africa]AAC97510.1 capsid protein [Nudaurelia capensis beta virus]
MDANVQIRPARNNPSQGNQGRNNNNKRRRRRRGLKLPPVVAPITSPGQMAEPANHANTRVNRGRTRVRGLRQAMMESPMAATSEAWIHDYLDPDGEYKTSLDDGKIPDGAIPQSTCGQFRGTVGARYPGLNSTTLPLDGGTWPLLVMHLPFFRHPLLFITTTSNTEVEVTNADLDAFANDWNNRTDWTEATYPSWAQVGNVFYMVVPTEALTDVPPPTQLGVSGLLESYRLTSSGVTAYFNAPTLVNQGVAVIAQFQPDKEHQKENPDIVAGTTQTGGTLQLGGSGPNYTLTMTIGDQVEFGGAAIPLPTVSMGPMPESGQLVFQTANLTFDVGNTITITTTLPPGSVTGMWQFTASNGTDTVTVDAGARLYAFGANLDASELNLQDINSIKIPPTNMNQMMQATPKTIQFQLNETKGFYMPLRAFQPVFEMTMATSYGPVRWKTPRTTVVDYHRAIGGLQDTIDSNFAIGVAAMTGMSTSTVPYFKVFRRFEAIPAEGSPWGPFASATPPKDDVALTVARTWTDLHPFAYPERYNGFGALFAMVAKTIAQIPRYVRSAAGVANAVTDCIESATESVASNSTSERRQRRARRVGGIARGARNLVGRIGNLSL